MIPVFSPAQKGHTGPVLYEVRKEHRSGRGRWWRQNGQGYTDDLASAGIFTSAEGVSGSATAYAVSLHDVIAAVRAEAKVLSDLADLFDRLAVLGVPERFVQLYNCGCKPTNAVRFGDDGVACGKCGRRFPGLCWVGTDTGRDTFSVRGWSA